jgi:ABC-type bacteriocin/lantibiotic exporter with double-glycine peptidase domain
MLLNYYGIYIDLSITELIKICDTDNKTGTTDKNLIMGLEHTNIPYEQNTNKSKKALSILKKRINNELFLMRTLTKGIPHWILISGYYNNMWIVLDPWLGNIRYTDDEITNIWKPRSYDGFYVHRELDGIVKYGGN